MPVTQRLQTEEHSQRVNSGVSTRREELSSTQHVLQQYPGLTRRLDALATPVSTNEEVAGDDTSHGKNRDGSKSSENVHNGGSSSRASPSEAPSLGADERKLEQSYRLSIQSGNDDRSRNEGNTIVTRIMNKSFNIPNAQNDKYQ